MQKHGPLGKKLVLMKPQIDGDTTSDLLYDSHTGTMKRTFDPGNHCFLVSILSMIVPQLKDKWSAFPTFLCIYESNYFCGENFTGFTTRQLSQWDNKYLTWWFRNSQNKTIHLSFLSQLIDQTKAFTVVHLITWNLLNGVRFYSPPVSQANSFTFYIQKRFVAYLLLS